MSDDEINLAPWRAHFPLPNPRRQQVEALDWVDDRIVSGKRILVMELGTGVGKSAVGFTIAAAAAACSSSSAVRGGYVLTSQLGLQDQYATDFGGRGLVDLRSSAHFSCDTFQGQTCGETARLRKCVGSLPRCEACPYRSRKEAFMRAAVSVTSYAYLLHERAYNGELVTRDVLFMDECHRAEEEVARWASVRVGVDEMRAARVDPPSRVDETTVRAWFERVYAPAARARLTALRGTVEMRLATNAASAARSAWTKKLASELDALDRHVCALNRALELGVDSVAWSPDPKEGAFELKPIDATPIVAASLLPAGRLVVAVTATAMGRAFALSSLGVAGRSDVDFISRPSPFPDSAFGVVYRPSVRVNKGRTEADEAKLVAAVVRILAEHPDEKGVVHTGSYRLTRLIAGAGGGRMLVQETAKDKADLVERHRRSRRPTVLVSPGLTEGLDLPDDLGRFQVICKVPYPYLGDAAVRERASRDRNWYSLSAARAIVQAVGRCVRHEGDWARNYILDECFTDLFVRHSDVFPPYFASMVVEDA